MRGRVDEVDDGGKAFGERDKEWVKGASSCILLN